MLFSSLSGLVSFILIPLNKLELSAGLDGSCKTWIA
jgi:hypothetical protein